MLNMEDILARLQNGEDAQDIANEFADVINQANKAYADQKAKEEEERIAKERVKQIQQDKEDELDEILEYFKEWMRRYYPKHDKIILEAFDGNTAKDVITSIETIFDLIDIGYASLMKIKSPVVKKTAAKADRNGKSADIVLNDFLKTMGW